MHVPEYNAWQEGVWSGTQWIIAGGICSLATVVTSLALQSIDPFLYAFAPSLALIVIGLIKCKDKKNDDLKGFINAFALSILLEGIAAGAYFGLHNSTMMIFCETGAFAIMATPFLSQLLNKH